MGKGSCCWIYKQIGHFHIHTSSFLLKKLTLKQDRILHVHLIVAMVRTWPLFGFIPFVVAFVMRPSNYWEMLIFFVVIKWHCHGKAYYNFESWFQNGTLSLSSTMFFFQICFFLLFCSYHSCSEMVPSVTRSTLCWLDLFYWRGMR